MESTQPRSKGFDIKGLEINFRLCLGRATTTPPIGLHLARTARIVNRAFDEALVEAGGSLPVWLVLLNLKTRRIANQRELAEAVGVREATLTHHLNAMETNGLLTRRRDRVNRRIHVIELTPAGEATFLRLRGAATVFDRRLRHHLTREQLEELEGLLNRLTANVGTEDHAAPWTGLIENSS